MGDTTPFDPKGPPECDVRVRLWPAVLIVALQWPVTRLPGVLMPGTYEQFQFLFFGAMIATGAILLWWLFASRVPWKQRLLILAAFIVIGIGSVFPTHSTLKGFGIIIYGLPAATTAWVLWLLISRNLAWSVRRAGLLAAFGLAFGWITLFRIEGINGSFAVDLRPRWQASAEEQFLAEAAARKPAGSVPTTGAVALHSGDWPGFRGPSRDSRLFGVRIPADWTTKPPRQIWRQRIGPGWSSFAVVAGRLYTQEQRGQQEAVVCYDAATGAECWVHLDDTRFIETVSGAGPRGTPTFDAGRIYALGARGALNCLDAATGESIWKRDITVDSGRAAAAKADPTKSLLEVPMWGFASSPLVVNSIVSVFAGGPDGKSVLGYHASSGELAWSAGQGTDSYCSTQLSRLSGVDQLLISTDAGITSIHPVQGKVLWQHTWQTEKGLTRIIQPTVLSETDLLLGTGLKMGTRRIHIEHEGNSADDAWTDREIWTTVDFKPYFNDMVAYKGHIFGFTGAFFACIGLDDHRIKWKDRAYGNGQSLLLADQGILLVLSEKGDVALVEPTPERLKELCRFKAIEGKTWNHPVLAHGKLYVRNGEEAACFEVGTDSGPVAIGR